MFKKFMGFFKKKEEIIKEEVTNESIREQEILNKALNERIIELEEIIENSNIKFDTIRAKANYEFGQYNKAIQDRTKELNIVRDQNIKKDMELINIRKNYVKKSDLKNINTIGKIFGIEITDDVKKVLENPSETVNKIQTSFYTSLAYQVGISSTFTELRKEIESGHTITNGTVNDMEKDLNNYVLEFVGGGFYA